MNIDWSRDFDRQYDRLEADETPRGRVVFDRLLFMLNRLQELDDAPTEESAMLKRVRQSGRYDVWRVSHPFVQGVALRLICYFPRDGGPVVAVLFSGEKAAMGDVFYDSVGTRADQMIDRWIDETEQS